MSSCVPAADGFIIRPELQMNLGRIILKNDPVLGGLTCKPCLPVADGFIIRPELQMNEGRIILKMILCWGLNM